MAAGRLFALSMLVGVVTANTYCLGDDEVWDEVDGACKEEDDTTVHMQTIVDMSKEKRRVRVEAATGHEQGALPQDQEDIVATNSAISLLQESSETSAETPAGNVEEVPGQQESGVSVNWEDDTSGFNTRMQAWGRSAQTAPFVQIFAAILGMFVVLFTLRASTKAVRWLVATLRCSRERAKLQGDASERLQVLLKSLRFEPSDSPKSQEMQPMQPVTELDSGCNSEEEPEAESQVGNDVKAKSFTDSPKKPITCPWSKKPIEPIAKAPKEMVEVPDVPVAVKEKATPEKKFVGLKAQMIS